MLHFGFQKASDGLAVRLGRDGPGGPFVFDPGSHLVAERLQRIEDGSVSRNDLLYVGARLWGALRGPPAVREQVDAALRLATKGAPLEIVLELPDDPDVRVLVEPFPWEALADEHTHTFAADPQFRLSRAVAWDDQPSAPAPPPADLPLRVLVAIPEGTGLKSESELQRLESVHRGLLEITPLRGPVTSQALREALRAGRYQVLHFVGHGDVRPNEGPTILLNPREGEGWDRIDSAAFARLIMDCGLRLVVLNSCSGSAPGGLQALSGLGPDAIRVAGLQAVVAMRYAIADADALLFAKAFYRSMVETGRVDAAVQAARFDMLVNCTGDYEGKARAFTTPVLYLAEGGAEICRPAVERPAASPPPRAGRVPAAGLPPGLAERLRSGQVIPVVGEPSPPLGQRGVAGPPSLDGLLQHLLGQCQGAEARQEIIPLVEAGDCFLGEALARACQYLLCQGQDWSRLVAEVAGYYAKAEPSTFVRAIASWRCPGYLYLPFDGRMEAALVSIRRKVNGLVPPVDEAATPAPAPAAVSLDDDRVLVNVQGTLSAPENLLLTERDRDRLLEGIPRKVSNDVFLLLRGSGKPRSLLFLGLSPRDPLVRGLARLIDKGEKRMQGTPYFVAERVSAADEAYWRDYRVGWIRQEPAAVVEALTESLT